MTKQKNSPLEDGVHHTQVRVRFGDTDPYGIVYFVSYFRYCHQAIEEFLRAVGLPPEETFKNVPGRFRTAHRGGLGPLPPSQPVRRPAAD